MNAVVEAEIVSPEPEEVQPGLRFTQVRAIGVLGTFLAILTMFAAVGVGFLALFGTTLASAGLIWLIWPYLFTPAFTAWVFGKPQVEFWKLFVLFLAVGALVKLIRSYSNK